MLRVEGGWGHAVHYLQVAHDDRLAGDVGPSLGRAFVGLRDHPAEDAGVPAPPGCLESPQLRQRCQAGLNKSEQRHALAQVICTFRQGRIADRGQDGQQFRASGLNLVIAAIAYWNSTYIADAVAHLRDQGVTKPPPRGAFQSRAILVAYASVSTG